MLTSFLCHSSWKAEVLFLYFLLFLQQKIIFINYILTNVLTIEYVLIKIQYRQLVVKVRQDRRLCPFCVALSTFHMFLGIFPECSLYI